MAGRKLIWIGAFDASNRPVQIYAVCKKHAEELLKRKPKYPAYYTKRITKRTADKILRREMGYGAYAEVCDLCLHEHE